jgi:Tfp pilus assembly protein PilF
LKSDANNLNAKYFRAKAYEKIGEVKKALAEFKKLKKSGYSDSATLYESVSRQLQ